MENALPSKNSFTLLGETPALGTPASKGDERESAGDVEENVKITEKTAEQNVREFKLQYRDEVLKVLNELKFEYNVSVYEVPHTSFLGKYESIRGIGFVDDVEIMVNYYIVRRSEESVEEHCDVIAIGTSHYVYANPSKLRDAIYSVVREVKCGDEIVKHYFDLLTSMGFNVDARQNMIIANKYCGKISIEILIPRGMSPSNFSSLHVSIYGFPPEELAKLANELPSILEKKLKEGEL